VLAEARLLASQKYRELKQPALARGALDLAFAAIEDAAASFDRNQWWSDARTSQEWSLPQLVAIRRVRPTSDPRRPDRRHHGGTPHMA